LLGVSISWPNFSLLSSALALCRKSPKFRSCFYYVSLTFQRFSFSHLIVVRNNPSRALPAPRFFFLAVSSNGARSCSIVLRSLVPLSLRPYSPRSCSLNHRQPLTLRHSTLVPPPLAVLFSCPLLLDPSRNPSAVCSADCYPLSRGPTPISENHLFYYPPTFPRTHPHFPAPL